MRIGVPKEIKVHEYRVGMTPASVAELVAHGHEVVVETNAGNGIDCPDKAYEKAGAKILPDAPSVFKAADMIVKVKEPQPQEIALLEPRHILFTYLHLAADKDQALGLMKSGATCIAYETVTSKNGSLPLLKPMSEVAGRMSVQVGAHYLEKEQGGRGVLLGGVPGVNPARVAILGGGVVACEAATWLLGLGVEELTLIDVGDRILARAEPFAGDLVRRSLEASGAKVITETKVLEVSRKSPKDNGIGHISGGPVTLHIGRRRSIVVDELVVATGRTASTQDLGLEAVGIADAVAQAHGYIRTNDQLQVDGVSGRWLYAVGDVNGRALLTHMGKYQGRIAGAVIAARAGAGERAAGKEFRDRASERVVPSVTFTSPEVASVGLTEQAARDLGIDVETVEYDTSQVSGAALLLDGYVGRAKLVIDRARDVLVGATFVGTGSAELVHSATVAIIGGVTLSDLWHAVPSYPTVSEVWLRLLEARRG